MGLPANISIRNITGKYLDFQGNPMAGQVSFAIPQALIDAAAATILIPSKAVATLDNTGAFSVNIPVTDDVDLNPLNFLYTVTENFAGGRTFQVPIPTGAGALDMSAVAPAPTFALVYLLVSSVLWALLVNRVVTEEALFNTSIPTYRGVNAAGFTADTAFVQNTPSPLLTMGV